MLQLQALVGPAGSTMCQRCASGASGPIVPSTAAVSSCFEASSWLLLAHACRYVPSDCHCGHAPAVGKQGGTPCEAGRGQHYVRSARFTKSSISYSCLVGLCSLSLENQQLREKVEILEYLLAQSETDAVHVSASAPSSEVACVLLLFDMCAYCL